jgi:nucleoside-diphosphate-sugar epimerase
MERADGLQVVLGAGGGIGRAIVEDLAGRGRRVRAVSRGPLADLPTAVEHVRADLYDPVTSRQAVSSASVVYHAAQPPYARWDGNFERLNDSIAGAAAAAGARLVFADNLYLYGPDASPMREDSPQRATDRKGRLRRRLAADLLARHERGELEVVIGRPSDYFGPHGENTGLGERVFGAAIRGATADVVGSLDARRSFSYLPDIARSMVVLGDRDDAAGRVWHLPVTDPLTVRELLTHVYGVAGTPLRVRLLGPRAVRVLGVFVPVLREVGVILYQWTDPFVSDWSAFRAAFGPFERTPLDESIATTLAWWRVREAAPARGAG